MGFLVVIGLIVYFMYRENGIEGCGMWFIVISSIIVFTAIGIPVFISIILSMVILFYIVIQIMKKLNK